MRKLSDSVSEWRTKERSEFTCLMYSILLWLTRSVRKVMSNICEAIKFMHAKGVCHQDLKPENIVGGVDQLITQ